jgi:aminoglycoside phosphotransferase family enzyme/predicted kinase
MLRAHSPSLTVVDVMSDPRLYGPSVHAVEVRETHISWVFLAGERAYKVKKPVLMPFLDYRELETRRQYCFEEVRLNRRLAPDVYLGVRALVRAGDGFAIGPESASDALEYLVEMRRLRDDAYLAQRIARPGFDTGSLDKVATALASFHRSAPRAPDAKPFRSQLEPALTSLVTHATPQARTRMHLLARSLRDLHDDCREELCERAARGLVCEGHGDLRAEHVVLDPPAIVDCVEFDRALREIDPGADIAFLAMDVERLGGQVAAEHLVERYRAAGGDPGSPCLQALFRGYRACVRAEIAELRAEQLDGSARERALDDARAHVRLAWRYVWRAQLPLVLVVCGPPGVGKSTLAGAIAEVSGLEHLSSDRVRKRLAGLAPTEPAPAVAYTDAARQAVYRELGTRCGAAREGAVVDATFGRRADRDAFLAAAGNVEPLVVECALPSAALAARAARRMTDARAESDATPEIAARLAREFEPLAEVPNGRLLDLITDEPVELLVARVAAWIASRSRGELRISDGGYSGWSDSQRTVRSLHGIHRPARRRATGAGHPRA